MQRPSIEDGSIATITTRELLTVHGGGTAYLAREMAEGRRNCEYELGRMGYFVGEARKALPADAWKNGATLTPDQARAIQNGLDFGSIGTRTCANAAGVEPPPP